MSKAVKITVSLVFAAFITGCASTQTRPVERVEIKTTPIERPELTLPSVDRFTARDVNWIIITPENAEEVFASLQAQGSPVALFGLTDTGYENISINTQESLRIILQQQAVINGYQEYYLQADQAIETHNNRSQ